MFSCCIYKLHAQVKILSAKGLTTNEVSTVDLQLNITHVLYIQSLDFHIYKNLFVLKQIRKSQDFPLLNYLHWLGTFPQHICRTAHRVVAGHSLAHLLVETACANLARLLQIRCSLVRWVGILVYKSPSL